MSVPVVNNNRIRISILRANKDVCPALQEQRNHASPEAAGITILGIRREDKGVFVSGTKDGQKTIRGQVFRSQGKYVAIFEDIPEAILVT